MRWTVLAAVALAAPLQALLFSTGPPRGAVRRNHLSSRHAAVHPVGPLQERSIPSLDKRAGPGKAQHCSAKKKSKSTGPGVKKPTNSVVIDSEPKNDPVTEVGIEVPAKPSSTPAPKITSTKQQAAKPTTAAPKETPAQSSDTGNASDGLTDAQRASFLSLHNSIRAEHNANALTWSNELAQAAKSWADKCVFEHSRGKLGPYGENLAAGTGGNYDVAAAMKSWTDEIKDYNAGNPQPSHYTQVVWRGSTQLGCALAPACAGIFDSSFGTAKYFVCEYSPAGNVIGRFAENVQ